MTIIRSNAVLSFLPSMSALHCDNEDAPPIQVPTPFGDVSLSLFSNGLCNGMTFAVLDFWVARSRVLMTSVTGVPPASQPPGAPGVPTPPLLTYLEQRAVDGNGPADWLKGPVLRV